MGKNWAHFVEQCWLQVLQIFVHHINLLSTLLRCNGFAWIQKAAVDQIGSTPQTVDMNFFGAGLDLGNGLELLSPTTELVIASCHKIHLSSHVTTNREMVCCCCIEEEKMTLQSANFFDFQLIHEAPIFQAFSSFQFASNVE